MKIFFLLNFIILFSINLFSCSSKETIKYPSKEILSLGTLENGQTLTAYNISPSIQDANFKDYMELINFSKTHILYLKHNGTNLNSPLGEYVLKNIKTNAETTISSKYPLKAQMGYYDSKINNPREEEKISMSNNYITFSNKDYVKFYNIEKNTLDKINFSDYLEPYLTNSANTFLFKDTFYMSSQLAGILAFDLNTKDMDIIYPHSKYRPQEYTIKSANKDYLILECSEYYHSKNPSPCIGVLNLKTKEMFHQKHNHASFSYYEDNTYLAFIAEREYNDNLLFNKKLNSFIPYKLSNERPNLNYLSDDILKNFLPLDSNTTNLNFYNTKDKKVETFNTLSTFKDIQVPHYRVNEGAILVNLPLDNPSSEINSWYPNIDTNTQHVERNYILLLE